MLIISLMSFIFCLNPQKYIIKTVFSIIKKERVSSWTLFHGNYNSLCSNNNSELVVRNPVLSNHLLPNFGLKKIQN